MLSHLAEYGIILKRAQELTNSFLVNLYNGGGNSNQSNNGQQNNGQQNNGQQNNNGQQTNGQQ